MNHLNEKYHKKLKDFISNHKIPAKLFVFENSCHSVLDASKNSGENIKNFVKNICMIDDSGNLIVAIVRGEDRASTSRVGKFLKIERPRLATVEEILKMTGFPCGGTSSFGFNALFLIDEKILEIKNIVTGGGSEYALIKIASENLQKANNGKICRVRK